MPSIWNVNNNINTNDKKVSSKLTFEVGEKFSGKIVEQGANNQVVVKLRDGWQFPAQISEKVDLTNQPNVQFQVAGFENGKIVLNVLKNSEKSENANSEDFTEVITQEGLSDEDISLLKSMVKHEIPLTKDNVVFTKSLIDFNQSIKESPEKSSEFIEKFLLSKGIEITSENGQMIKNTLNDFLNQYKTLSSKDILFFLENNIDLNKENIQSFNKLFKGTDTVVDYFKNYSENFNVADQNPDNKEISKPDSQNMNQTKIDNTNENQQTDIENQQSRNSQDTTFASKVYSKNEAPKGNENILSALKTLVQEEENVLKEPIRSILIDRKPEVSANQFKEINSKISELTDERILQEIPKGSEINKETLNKVVSNIFGRDIKLTDEEVSKLKNIFDFKMNSTQENENIEMPEELEKDTNPPIQNQSASENQTQSVKDTISSFIKDNIENGNPITKESLSKFISESTQTEINLTEKDFGDIIKLVNNNLQNTEPEFQAQPHNQVNNSQNQVKPQNQPNNLQEKSKIQAQGNKPQEQSKINQDLQNNIKNLAENKIDISSNQAIKSDIKDSIAEIKNIVQDIIKITQGGSDNVQKAMDIIKSNINDFKLFNSVSNEYYYLDVPIKQNGNEYPCKLIIKDSRNKGKKIDSKNVKMVLSVKTINLGSVDGYIGINNKRLNIEIKCDKEYINIVNSSKKKLIEGLSNLGFITSVDVDKKVEEVSLSTCSEYFNDNNSKSIDIKV